MKLYSVKDWAIHYENNRTRELKFMTWIPVPNSQDGDGYTALVCRPDGPELFGAWIAILQVASKCGNPAGRCGARGSLVRDTGKPHDVASISRMCHFPEKTIKKALEVLCSDDVGWLEYDETPINNAIPQEGATIPQEGATIPQATATERNGTERNGTIPDSVASLPVKGVIQLRVEAMFGRRKETPQSDKEKAAFKKAKASLLATTDEEWKAIEEYYTTDIETFRRGGIVTALNNWPGEIDKANKWISNGRQPEGREAQNQRPGQVKPDYTKSEW